MVNLWSNLRASVGHTCVGSGHSLRRTGHIDRSVDRSFKPGPQGRRLFRGRTDDKDRVLSRLSPPMQGIVPAFARSCAGSANSHARDLSGAVHCERQSVTSEDVAAPRNFGNLGTRTCIGIARRSLSSNGDFARCGTWLFTQVARTEKARVRMGNPVAGHLDGSRGGVIGKDARVLIMR